MARADLKKFKGNRIQVPTVHAGIKKILVWDSRANEYVSPENGKRFLARKQVLVNGQAKTINRYFDSLKECMAFRFETASAVEVGDHGPLIKDLIDEYVKSPAWEQHQYSTQVLYEGLFQRWFDLLEDVPIHKLDAQRVSKFIADLKANVDRYGNANQRKSFRKEFDLLKTLLTWYQNYKDDTRFVSPIKSRHEEEYWLDNVAHASSDKDFDKQVDDEIPLTEDEYEVFRAELSKAKFGDSLCVLADVQFDHSLRVSEAAALMWSDIKPFSPDWQSGEIKFQRHIQYIHRTKEKFPDRIVPGLKNRKTVKRSHKRFDRRTSLSKTHPFFPRSIAGLKRLYLKANNKHGLCFVNPETNEFFTYKCIKDKYDRAFRRAGFAYTGTHIVRYGGVNSFIEKYDADEETAMELLGNKSEGRYILRRSKNLHRTLSSIAPNRTIQETGVEKTAKTVT